MSDWLRQRVPLSLKRALVAGYRTWPTEARWFLDAERWRSQRQLAHYANKHAGQRCFIIGNGPSLNRMDLQPLRHEVTFGLNRIYLLFPHLGFHTTYLASVNQLVLEQCAAEIASLPMPKFVSRAGRPFLPQQNDIIYLKTIGGAPHFAQDPRRGVWESGTVTYVALQLAFFMGFSQVILLGVDHNFQSQGPANQTVVSPGDDPNHFAANYFGQGFRWQLPDLYHSELGYALARQVYAANGRCILDATVGGKLQIFPKVAYETVVV